MTDSSTGTKYQLQFFVDKNRIRMSGRTRARQARWTNMESIFENLSAAPGDDMTPYQFSRIQPRTRSHSEPPAPGAASMAGISPAWAV